METEPRSWWQKQKKLVIVGLIALLVVIGLIYAGYQFSWTGFPSKTLWDWLNLLGVLAIPVAVGFGTVWFTQAQQHRDQQLADQRAQEDHAAAEMRAQADRLALLDIQREAAMKEYIDKISELLLHGHFDESSNKPQAKSIAQARTATVLRTLDPIRCASIIQFLSRGGILRLCVENSAKSSMDWPLKNEYSLAGIELPETNFSRVDLSMIHLEGANFYRAILREANLEGTDLSGANLQGANLMHANLRKANLSGANLQSARLFGADLRDANLVGTDLEKAELRYVKFSNRQVQLARVKSLKDATMSDEKPYD